MTMSGMDVSAIRDVARQLSQQSESVAEAMRGVDSLLEVARHNWQGQDLQQFDATWVDQYRGTCVRLGANLADLARVARENADAQERASESLGGAAFGGSGGWEGPGPHIGNHMIKMGNLAPEMYDWLMGQAGTVGKAIDYSSFGMILKYGKPAFDQLNDVPAWKGLNSTLGYLGILGGGVEAFQGVASDDYGKAWGGVVDVGLGIAGVALGSAATPVVVPLTILKTFVDATIPYSSESQDSLLNYQAQRMFGSDSSHLTPDQSQELSQHYEGLGGAINMISDKMDQTAQPISDAGDKFFRWVGWKK